jgi:hypothetical protein
MNQYPLNIDELLKEIEKIEAPSIEDKLIIARVKAVIKNLNNQKVAALLR